MNIGQFREVIKKREKCHNEWSYGIEQCWQEEIRILAEDIPSTIEYLKHECTADEFSWISEIIEDLASKTQNRELVECYISLKDKFPDEYRICNIAESIECALSELIEVSDNEENRAID